MGSFYPVLVSDRMIDTVNFYEDFFGFVPAIEQDGYAFLQCPDNPDVCIAVFDVAHERVASHLLNPPQGMILSLPVDDVQGAYDKLYMEGLSMYKDYGIDIHGNKHFIVTDPNGVLINVCEPLDTRKTLTA